MAFPQNKCGAIQGLARGIQGCRKRHPIGNVQVGLHPGRWIVTALHAMRALAAMCSQREQQRIDPVAGQPGLRRVDPVIDIGVPHLLRQRVGQGFEGERGTVGGFQVQGLCIRAFDLGDDQHIESAAGGRRRIDDGTGGLAFDVGAV